MRTAMRGTRGMRWTRRVCPVRAMRWLPCWVAIGVMVPNGGCRSASVPPEPVATPAVTVPVPAPTPTGDPIEGFGVTTMGGASGRAITIVEPSTAMVRQAFSKARTGNVTLRFPTNARIVLNKMLPHLAGPGVTIEGNGTTIDGTELAQEVALIDVRSHDMIIRNLRLRNGYDNLRVQGPDAFNVVIDHVSSTGARDDGIAITHGAHDVTVQYSFLAGNTRALFSKYDDTHNVSLHHTLMQKNWVRSPLFAGTTGVDVRNVIIEDWGLWGARFEDGASGNLVASLFVLSPYAMTIGGKGDSALRLKGAGAVYARDNEFRSEAAALAHDSAAAPLDAPPVQTLAVAAMEPLVRARAGCLPRDDVDRAYLGLSQGWRVSESEPLRVRLE